MELTAEGPETSDGQVCLWPMLGRNGNLDFVCCNKLFSLLKMAGHDAAVHVAIRRGKGVYHRQMDGGLV
jgi:hypothetical protein